MNPDGVAATPTFEIVEERVTGVSAVALEGDTDPAARSTAGAGVTVTVTLAVLTPYPDSITLRHVTV